MSLALTCWCGVKITYFPMPASITLLNLPPNMWDHIPSQNAYPPGHTSSSTAMESPTEFGILRTLSLTLLIRMTTDVIILQQSSN